MSSPSRSSFFSRVRSSSSSLSPATSKSSSSGLQVYSKNNPPKYTLNDLPPDTIYLITSFLIPRIPQLNPENVQHYIKQMIEISSISRQYREWSECETVQNNFWKDFLFQQLARWNVRLSLVQVSSKDTLQFSSNQNLIVGSGASTSNSSSSNNNSTIVSNGKEDWMNGAFIGSNFSEAGYWDDEDDDYFEDDVRYQTNDVNSLLRRGDYLSYTNGGPAATQRILLKIAMNPDKIKHMLFNMWTYFHYELNAKAKKGLGRRTDPFASRRHAGLDLL